MTTDSRRSLRRRGPIAKLGAALAVAALALLATPGVASAHNVLIDTDPANGATLDTAPETVTLTYNEAVKEIPDAQWLIIYGPDDMNYAVGDAKVDDNTLSAPFAAGPAGDYRAVFRAVSADGHPVNGELTFTLTDAAAGDAKGTTPPVIENDSERGPWLWIGLSAAGVLIVVAIVVAVRRHPEEGGPAPDAPDQK